MKYLITLLLFCFLGCSEKVSYEKPDASLERKNLSPFKIVEEDVLESKNSPIDIRVYRFAIVMIEHNYSLRATEQLQPIFHPYTECSSAMHGACSAFYNEPCSTEISGSNNRFESRDIEINNFCKWYAKKVSNTNKKIYLNF